MKNENLGKIATDKLTGFKGVVTGYSEYLTGCSQYCLQPKIGYKGEWVEARWFDEGKVVFTKDVKISHEELIADENGCDTNHPHVG